MFSDEYYCVQKNLPLNIYFIQSYALFFFLVVHPRLRLSWKRIPSHLLVLEASELVGKLVLKDLPVSGSLYWVCSNTFNYPEYKRAVNPGYIRQFRQFFPKKIRVLV